METTSLNVGSYAERDAELTLNLWKVMQKEIIDQDLGSIFELETDLFPCLVDMKFKGVRVDVEAAHKLKQQLAIKRRNITPTSKNRDRNRTSNMGSKINCQSF